MKRVLRTLTVTTLTSCLTTLQFTAAWAQGYEVPMETRVKRSQIAMPKRAQAELATPSVLIAPQRGALVDLSYTYSNLQFTTKKGPQEIKVGQSGHRGTTSLAAAITPNFFAGLTASYGTQESESSYQGNSFKSTSQGEDEPSLFAGARLNSGLLSVVGQLSYDIGIGDSESESKSSTKSESNMKSGGSAFHPSVAVFTNQKSSFVMGAQLGYRMPQDRTSVYRNGSGFKEETTESGGNSMNVNLFLETPQLSHSFGAALSYSKSEDSTENSLNEKRTIKGSENAVAMAYGNIKASSMLTIQPVLGYMRFLSDRTGEIELKEQSAFIGMIRARLNF